MTPEYLPDPALRPDASKSLAVEGAFTTLVQSLRAAALAPGADFDRCTSYLRAVETLAARWSFGDPAHGLRGKKATSGVVES